MDLPPIYALFPDWNQEAATRQEPPQKSMAGENPYQQLGPVRRQISPSTFFSSMSYNHCPPPAPTTAQVPSTAPCRLSLPFDSGSSSGTSSRIETPTAIPDTTKPKKKMNPRKSSTTHRAGKKNKPKSTLAKLDTTGLLKQGHMPAIGRARPLQLANMSEGQRAAEQIARLEKNRLSSREFREKKKNRIKKLEQTVLEYQARYQAQLNQIDELREEIKSLHAELEKLRKQLPEAY